MLYEVITRQELGAQAVIEPLLHSTHAGGVIPWFVMLIIVNYSSILSFNRGIVVFQPSSFVNRYRNFVH